MGNGCIIAVENLGKKYRIRHGEHERYVALRNVLVSYAKHSLHNVLQTVVNPGDEKDLYQIQATHAASANFPFCNSARL